jgi:5'-nucleotidase
VNGHVVLDGFRLRAAASAVSYWRVRILVTNDDGVHAPGLGAIARALAAWAAEGPSGGVGAGSGAGSGAAADETREVVVVAPLANHSGAGAAVGTVYEREAIAYRSVTIEGAESIPSYGLDASPALTVIIGALGAFGPRPDLVVSGINLGVNVGRSVLHSGTVGAALTGAQLGLSGLAVSMRSNAPHDHWETAAGLAVATLPLLAAAPPRTVLNLNVPSVPPGELRGVRRGQIGTAGIIKAAADNVRHEPGGAAVAGGAGGPAEIEGEIRLTLGTAVPQLGALGDANPDDDVALLAEGYASLTPLVGVHEDPSGHADALVAALLAHLDGLAAS